MGVSYYYLRCFVIVAVMPLRLVTVVWKMTHEMNPITRTHTMVNRYTYTGRSDKDRGGGTVFEYHIISLHWILIIVLYCLASVRSFVQNFRRDSSFKLCHWESKVLFSVLCIFFLFFAVLIVVLSFSFFFVARILCSRLTGLRQTSTY